ncbi:MAG: PrgI family protein [Lachnospiraceae bacterium]|nr:PrgI family protein [Lachnospiraceae bacterium]
MEVKINKEIRNYTESMFFGLSLRQFIFSVLACSVAVGLYFLLRPRFGTEMERIIKRGDIYYAELNPVIGSEQGGTRPVLIISNDIGNKLSPKHSILLSMLWCR